MVNLINQLKCLIWEEGPANMGTKNWNCCARRDFLWSLKYFLFYFLIKFPSSWLGIFHPRVFWSSSNPPSVSKFYSRGKKKLIIHVTPSTIALRRSSFFFFLVLLSLLWHETVATFQNEIERKKIEILDWTTQFPAYSPVGR